MDLGPHAIFIWLCYAGVGVVIAGLIGALVAEGGRLNRELADLEARGITRDTAKTSVSDGDA